MQLLLNNYWTLFCEKPPKGFGKFFGERNSKPPPKVENESSSKSESSDTPREKNRPERPKQGMDFKVSFGGGSDGKKSGGKGNSEKEKWFTFGMIGTALALAGMSYYGYSYQEISWKELTRYEYIHYIICKCLFSIRLYVLFQFDFPWKC